MTCVDAVECAPYIEEQLNDSSGSPGRFDFVRVFHSCLGWFRPIRGWHRTASKFEGTVRRYLLNGTWVDPNGNTSGSSTRDNDDDAHGNPIRFLTSGIGSRGDRSIIRDNYIEDVDGAGVRLGGWEVDGVQYGVDNQVCLPQTCCGRTHAYLANMNACFVPLKTTYHPSQTLQ